MKGRNIQSNYRLPGIAADESNSGLSASATFSLIY